MHETASGVSRVLLGEPSGLMMLCHLCSMRSALSLSCVAGRSHLRRQERAPASLPATVCVPEGRHPNIGLYSV